MSNEKEPRGLTFMKQIARLVCEEYGYDHEWSEEGDVFTVIIQCPPNNVKAVFDRDTLTDPDSRDYEIIAQAFMTKLLRDCRAARDARPPNSAPDRPATELH